MKMQTIKQKQDSKLDSARGSGNRKKEPNITKRKTFD